MRPVARLARSQPGRFQPALRGMRVLVMPGMLPVSAFAVVHAASGSDTVRTPLRRRHAAEAGSACGLGVLGLLVAARCWAWAKSEMHPLLRKLLRIGRGVSRSHTVWVLEGSRVASQRKEWRAACAWRALWRLSGVGTRGGRDPTEAWRMNDAAGCGGGRGSTFGAGGGGGVGAGGGATARDGPAAAALSS